VARDQPAERERRDSGLFRGRRRCRAQYQRQFSANIVKAIDLAKARSAKVFGIVGRDSGYAAKHGDVVIVIPQVNPGWVTPLSEAFQAVVWHCLVSHPALQRRQTKW
jgi:D-sedoheptulose 7-phosphate isomerase